MSPITSSLSSQIKRLLRSKYLSWFMVLSGLVLLLSVLVPILASRLTFSFDFQPELFDPTAVSTQKGPIVVNVLGLTSLDYTQVSNWFEKEPELATPASTRVSHYTLSIPSLDLLDVSIEINGSDLKKNAIHYPGTSLPGNYGNAVVFGHSALPQFYKKGDPITIFNPILKAEIGEVVIVNFDGISYRYIIKETKEIKPDQIEVLAQRYSKYELTLITCTPLGTYWNRWVVRAELEQ